MSEMEEKLGAILSNPQMMQQIMSMAQAMSRRRNLRVGRNNRRSLPLRRFRIFPSCRSSPG